MTRGGKIGAALVIAAVMAGAAGWWFATAGARQRASQPARMLVMPGPTQVPTPAPAVAPTQTPAAQANAAVAPAPTQIMPTLPAGIVRYAPGIPMNSPGQFALTDQNGNTVTEGSLRGHYSLVFFGYAHCQFCLDTLNQINLALAELGVSAESLRVYFITVDPARDTRAVMKGLFANAAEQMLGLTGTEDQVLAAVRAFGAARTVKPGADANTYTIDHTGVVFVIGRDSLSITQFAEGTPWTDMSRRIRELR